MTSLLILGPRWLNQFQKLMKVPSATWQNRLIESIYLEPVTENEIREAIEVATSNARKQTELLNYRQFSQDIIYLTQWDLSESLMKDWCIYCWR